MFAIYRDCSLLYFVIKHFYITSSTATRLVRKTSQNTRVGACFIPSCQICRAVRQHGATSFSSVWVWRFDKLAASDKLAPCPSPTSRCEETRIKAKCFKVALGRSSHVVTSPRSVGSSGKQRRSLQSVAHLCWISVFFSEICPSLRRAAESHTDNHAECSSVTNHFPELML